MDTAYWNEPVPLKQPYPNKDRLYFWEFMIYAFSYIMIFTALLSWLAAAQFDQFLPGRPWMLVLLFSGPGLLGLFFLWLAEWAHTYQNNRAWRQAFVANNADLNLNYRVVDTAVKMRRGFKLHKITFQVFVEQLAMHLREPDPLNIDQHSALSWDIIHLYYRLLNSTD